MEKKLSHIGSDNRPSMVDVSHKPQQKRTAVAEGFIALQPETLELISDNRMKKGNVLLTAELAGIHAAKKTGEMIPLCHTLLLSKVDIKATPEADGIRVTGTVVCTGQTGVEMEALSGVAQALLTIYDMCKAVDQAMEIGAIKLLNKTKE
ncbi:cyclic pyranopterin monophosphate synthase MoaC [Pontiella sp.]|uniref:cyclic pyranopterin monophosphate synthase MoaC n=1 Tax=Pontiella sp. TaxID=2837462 RepID=UPI003569D1CD